MKQQVTIKPMVRSVIKLNITAGILFFLLLLSQGSFCQIKLGKEHEKYTVISNAFRYSNEEIIKINKNTMAYEVWMDKIWGDDFYEDKGVGFCLFDDQELPKAFEELQELVKELESKKLLKKLIDRRFKLYRKENNDKVLTLSEPIILGNYSFLFRKSKRTKSLYVQKKNSEGIWDYECGVTLYGELH